MQANFSRICCSSKSIFADAKMTEADAKATGEPSNASAAVRHGVNDRSVQDARLARAHIGVPYRFEGINLRRVDAWAANLISPGEVPPRPLPMGQLLPRVVNCPMPR